MWSCVEFNQHILLMMRESLILIHLTLLSYSCNVGLCYVLSLMRNILTRKYYHVQASCDNHPTHPPRLVLLGKINFGSKLLRGRLKHPT